MSGDVHLVEEDVDRTSRASPVPTPSWAWLIIGFVVGIGFAVVFVNPGTEPAAPVDEEVLPPVGETTPPTLTDQAGTADETRGIGDAVDGFPDTLVAVTHVGGSSLEHLTWPVTGEQIVAPLAGFASGSVRFDVSGRMLALTAAIPDSPGLLLSMGNSRRVWPVATGVTGYSWHDAEAAELSFTQVVDGELLLWTVDSSREPELVTRRPGLGGRVAVWGDWGFAIQDGPELTLLTRDGELRTVVQGRALDSDPDGWIVVSNDGIRMVSAGGGVRALEVAELELIGEIEGGRLSPDGEFLAIAGGAGHLIVSVDGDEEAIHAPVTSGFPQLAWSSDSRFVLAPWIRGVLIIDTELAGRSQTELSTMAVVAVATVPLTSR